MFKIKYRVKFRSAIGTGRMDLAIPSHRPILFMSRKKIHQALICTLEIYGIRNILKYVELVEVKRLWK